MQIRKRISATVLAMMIFFSAFLTTASAESETPVFTDVNESHPYYTSIMYCYENGIYTGITETTFAPDDELTRAMFVTLLGRIAENAGLDTGKYAQSKFIDVEHDSWYSQYLNWATKKGIINGTSDTTFEPHASVTREQAIAIVIRFAEITYLELGTGDDAAFYDLDKVSEWAISYVETAIAAGLAIGYEDALIAPRDPATRAETADILYRLCEMYVGEELRLTEILNTYVPIIEGLPVNTYAAECFATQNGYKHYEDDSISAVLGIDVSTYQQEIDWAKVSASGIEFAIIRVAFRGYGTSGSLNIDDYFYRNIQGALENGIDVGVYFFSQAITTAEAIEEAEFVLSLIEDYPITYPVVFDWETISGTVARTDGLSGKILTDCAIAFCDTITAAGYTPMVYSNQALALLRYDLSRLQGYDFWLAEYNSIPGFYYDFQMWQYSSSGAVEGIDGAVDLNLCFADYSDRTEE